MAHNVGDVTFVFWCHKNFTSSRAFGETSDASAVTPAHPVSRCSPPKVVILRPRWWVAAARSPEATFTPTSLRSACASQETTLVLVKPEGIEAGVVGKCVSKFEEKGYKLKKLKKVAVSQVTAEAHYGEAGAASAAITSKDCVAMVWSGPGCIAGVLNLVGDADPAKAAPGSLRGDLAVSAERNLVEAASSKEEAARLIKLWLPPVDVRGALPTIKKGKISDMLKEWTSKTDQPFISFEYFPPRTPEQVEKLHKTIAYMGKQDPLFMDFTWGAGGTTSELTLDLSKQSQTQHQIMVNMHLTCTNQVKEKCDFGLNGAKAAGICNIVALRGDPPKGQEKWVATEGGFNCALDLVAYMRQNHGDYFSIQARTRLDP